VNAARKAIAAGLTAIATWGGTAQVDGIEPAEWWGLFGVLVAAFLVWLVPNSPEPLRGLDLSYEDEPTTPDRGAVSLQTLAYIGIIIVACISIAWFFGEAPRP